MRRLRKSPAIRNLVRETHLSPAHLIAPLFVVRGKGIRKPISSMPGQFQLSIDELIGEAGRIVRVGIPAVLLFGIPKKKDTAGSEAWAKNGISQLAIRALKKKFPPLVVITDLCFCEYTSHGHCGVLKNRNVDNDATLKNIQKTALAQAQAGADFVAPSGMMDGMIKAIRTALDKKKFQNVATLSYAAKYASAFYGPFREAAESTPKFGDRKAYQMDPGNVQEALREIRSDVAEGADMVMVKPALSYLDVISRIKPELNVPLVAYNVSGEYSMVKAAGKMGWLDPSKTALEILTSIKRAGADLIITYHALEVARQLR